MLLIFYNIISEKAIKMRAIDSAHNQALQKLKDLHGETPLITHLKYTVLDDQY